MNMTALQLVERFSALSAASNPSDITNMAVGQRRVMMILTLALTKLSDILNMCIGQNSTILIGCSSELMQGVAFPHVRSLDQAAPLPQDALCRPGQTIPKLACRTTWLALVSSQVLWALRWIWSIGQWMYVGLCRWRPISIRRLSPLEAL